ncbi:hypothetical protein C8J57DRAFT_1351368, partial [Mycena rebaudengoi]
MPSLLRLLLLATLIFGVYSESDATDPGDLEPAELLTPLKPQKSKSRGQTESKRQTVITGLLVSRQSCPPGYAGCPDGRCCQVGGQCCGTGHCCDPSSWCYVRGRICCSRTQNGCDNQGCCDFGDNCCKGGKCCDGSDYCVIVAGRLGCCPNGKVCTASGNGCSKSGYTPCAHEDFCCPFGSTCFRDSSNSRRCSAIGGSPPPPPPLTTPPPPPPPPTTHTPAQPTTKTTTDAPGRPSTHPIPSGSAPTSVPTPAAGSQNVVIDVNSNTAITWTGSWLSVTSSCSSGGKAKSCSGDSNTFASGVMVYSFTGTSIYISVASRNARYTITLDGVETEYGALISTSQTPSNCTFGWTRTGLSATSSHSLRIVVSGASESAVNGRRDITSPWGLEIQNLVITQPDSSSRTDSSAQETTTGGPEGRPGVHRQAQPYLGRLRFPASSFSSVS